MKDTTKPIPPDSFALVAVRSPSPTVSRPTLAKLAISSAASDFMLAVKKHQGNFLSLLRSFAPGVSPSASKIGCLRAGNIALMMSATIQELQAGGMCIALEHLYELACSEEKETRCLFDKDHAFDPVKHLFYH
jgi:hypothetical protein